MAIAVLKEPGQEEQFLVAEAYVDGRIWMTGPQIIDLRAPDTDVIVFNQRQHLQPLVEQLQQFAKNETAVQLRVLLLRASHLEPKLIGALILPTRFFSPVKTWWQFLDQLVMTLRIQLKFLLYGRSNLVALNIVSALRSVRSGLQFLD